jgi:hypothetical protein
VTCSTEIETAVSAAQDLAVGVAETVAWIFNPASAAQLLRVEENELESSMRGESALSVLWTGINAPSVLMVDRARDLAEYAWRGVWHGDPVALEEVMSEYGVVFELLRISPVSPSGGELFPAEARKTLERLWNATSARHQLDSGEAISVEQIAALAGVSEKTVRMAANPRNSVPLRTIKDGNRTLITATDALDWLTRRDFRPTRYHGEGPGQVLIVDGAALATCCKRWRDHASKSPAVLAESLGWSSKQSAAYMAMESGDPDKAATAFPPKALRNLAAALGMPDPDTFARQAYRVLALANAAAVIEQQLGSTHA